MQPPQKASVAGGKGLDEQHQVREKATGTVSTITQRDWMDKSRYPRDQFERVDESGAALPETDEPTSTDAGGQTPTDPATGAQT